jgi:hypothetical protein
MCISALGSLLEGVHMMQIPFPKALPFAASELFSATLDASETLLKVRASAAIRQQRDDDRNTLFAEVR